MATRIGVLVCLLIVVMDIVAGILGIKAEAAQNKVKDFKLGIFECKEPSHKAFVLGLVAATLLCLAHILANLLGGCTNCTTQEELPKPSQHSKLSVACLVFTWIILAAGLSMLVIGTKSNKKSRGSCGFTHHYILSTGGTMCFFHCLLCVAYYVSATATHS
ncbi:protein VASCULATURE COMPLEXITY AND CONNECTIVITY-like [Cornus florida]|uniref:protein VASCULATURE COMPLEXITY AND CONNECTIVITY-like n=1 Tax=Cornus florida TaxID=4283 RepID=UPI00289E6EC6|nr:protein VASCULATURE COMPLEXITY AND CONNECTIVITY-like [Cornus florida]